MSGVGAPAATMLATVDCGGSDVAQVDAGENGVVAPPGVVAMPEDASLDANEDGTIVDADTGIVADTGSADHGQPPHDGAPFDVVVADVVTGISIPPDAPYDGGRMGVIIMRDASNDTSFPGVQIPPEGGFFDVQGGPTEPPELPA